MSTGTEAKLKQLKAADLREILQKASVTLPARINKTDLVAKILATPAAVEIFNKQISSNGTSEKQQLAPQPSNSHVDNDLLAPPEQFDWDSTTESTTAKPAPVKSDVSVPAKPASAATAMPAEKPVVTEPSTKTTEPKVPQADDELDKRKKRAERFGVPLVEPKQKIVSTAKASQVSPQTAVKETSKLEARAARFGAPVTQARQKRGRSPAPVDKEEEEKRKKRAERFGNAGAGSVTQQERAQLLGQKGITIWLTGLSASGKSTIACALEQHLLHQKRFVYRLDGDNIRFGLNKDLGFSEKDRAENIRRIGEVSKLFADASAITITAFISPYRADRDLVRGLNGKDNIPFIEVFIDVPLSVAEERDPKGLYKKARAGEIKDFTGISAPYEEPENPEIHIRTDQTDVAQSVEIIAKYLSDKGYI
ncbi:hypothetical protein Clacol_000575 [Clathrus columnatus]|uniref:Adenylyl-sulfate kinase n=1 Tax=Clathrus columnatus TaxID=1419009 RepID=A0AAV5A0Z0_9AGAM|nr:hypothetical protein Clacol_000575 [Clathrus columnatus]